MPFFVRTEAEVFNSELEKRKKYYVVISSSLCCSEFSAGVAEKQKNRIVAVDCSIANKVH